MASHDKAKENPSELIRGRDVGTFDLWPLPRFDEPCAEPASPAPQESAAEPVAAAALPPAVEEVEPESIEPPTLEELEAIRREAYNEGFSTGERDGFHAGQLKARQSAEEALKARLESLERLMGQLMEPIAEQDMLIEQGLVSLVSHVAREVIQRELHIDSSQVRQVLREALKLLPMGAENIRIHVNPQDFERVKALRERHEESWRILEDDSLLPGGCRIETEHSRIDATIETRLAQAVKQLFEQRREQATHPLASDMRIDLDAPGNLDAP